MKSLGALIHLACCIKNHNKSAVSDIYLCALCVCVCSMHVCVFVCTGPVRFRMLYALFWPPAAATQKCMLHFCYSALAWLHMRVCVCVGRYLPTCVFVSVCVCVCACARVFEVKINKKSCKRRIKRISLSSLSIQSKISDRIRIHITLIGFSWKMLTLYLKINERKKHHNHTAC